MESVIVQDQCDDIVLLAAKKREKDIMAAIDSWDREQKKLSAEYYDRKIKKKFAKEAKELFAISFYGTTKDLSFIQDQVQIYL